MIVDIPLTDPIFRTYAPLTPILQIPSIQYWRGSGGGISERGADSETPHFKDIYDDVGNLMVVMTHNTDISDAWEREFEDRRFFYSFSPIGYSFGINVLLYAMTH